MNIIVYLVFRIHYTPDIHAYDKSNIARIYQAREIDKIGWGEVITLFLLISESMFIKYRLGIFILKKLKNSISRWVL